MPRGGSVGSLGAIAIELHQLDVVVRRPVDQLEVRVGEARRGLAGLPIMSVRPGLRVRV